MSRAISFEEEVDLGPLVKNIIAKYGEPSFQEVKGDYSQEYRYVYRNGAITSDIEDCKYTSNDAPTGHHHRYKFKENRKNRHPSCNGEIRVQITYGARTDLAKSLRISMWDYDLYYRDLNAQDEFLLQELQAEIASKSGAKAPAL